MHCLESSAITVMKEDIKHCPNRKERRQTRPNSYRQTYVNKTTLKEKSKIKCDITQILLRLL